MCFALVSKILIVICHFWVKFQELVCSLLLSLLLGSEVKMELISLGLCETTASGDLRETAVTRMLLLHDNITYLY